jgi:hypothetical protein
MSLCWAAHCRGGQAPGAQATEQAHWRTVRKILFKNLRQIIFKMTGSGALRFAVLSGGFGRRGFGCPRRSPARAAGTQPDHGARWRRQRLPSGDSSDVRSCLGVVGDPRKSPAQLNSGRQLAVLVEDGADCIGIGLGYEEHPHSMVARSTAGKRDVVSLISR